MGASPGTRLLQRGGLQGSTVLRPEMAARRTAWRKTHERVLAKNASVSRCQARSTPALPPPPRAIRASVFYLLNGALDNKMQVVSLSSTSPSNGRDMLSRYREHDYCDGLPHGGAVEGAIDLAMLRGVWPRTQLAELEDPNILRGRAQPMSAGS